MSKIIIFDFNRTLYNPDMDKLTPNSLSILSTLKDKGFLLYLVSSANDGKDARKKLIRELKIEDFFAEIIVSDDKELKDFESVIGDEVEKEFSYVIGDRVQREIAFGNACKLNTIWYKSGKFSNDLPASKQEEPDFIVENLIDILNLIG